MPSLLPDDAHNRRLVALVHPKSWAAPVPQERYNLVVIGGGPAGLVSAFGAAALGAKVALVERHYLGGDCLVTGCIPSKALLSVAHAAQGARQARELGIDVPTVDVDFGAAMERMRRIRADIGPHDSVQRLSDAGVDVFLGDATFSGPEHVQVGEVSLRFAKCVIATGARAVVTPIPGLSETGVRTNNGIFELTELPPRLTIVGAGVIGCEMAQAFAAMGSAVTMIDMADRVLPCSEREASEILQRVLVGQGVTLLLGQKVKAFSMEAGQRVTQLESGQRVLGDQILLAIGRRPNVELGLDKAGVQTTRAGVTVDDNLRTANPRIFACGDVIGQHQFTHAADHQARIVIKNALFFGRAKVSKLVIPSVVYTCPEIAQVGLRSSQAEGRSELRAWRVSIGDTDRGRTEGETQGYCRVWANDAGKIFGATVVGQGAGELLAPLTLAMTHGLGLAQIATTIHPYPTRSELIFKVAAAWNRTRLTPTVLRWMRRLLAWQR